MEKVQDNLGESIRRSYFMWVLQIDDSLKLNSGFKPQQDCVRRERINVRPGLQLGNDHRNRRKNIH